MSKIAINSTQNSTNVIFFILPNLYNDYLILFYFKIKCILLCGLHCNRKTKSDTRGRSQQMRRRELRPPEASSRHSAQSYYRVITVNILHTYIQIFIDLLKSL